MLKKGLAVAVILLFIGVAVAPNINADVNKPIIDTPIEDVAPTPIVLVLQLLTKLRNHKDIQKLEESIDSVENLEDKILQIIESDEELNIIFEQLFVEDCGCEDDIPTWERLWPFPFICNVIGIPLFMFAWLAWMMQGITWIGEMAGIFGLIFNCHWY